MEPIAEDEVQKLEQAQRSRLERMSTWRTRNVSRFDSCRVRLDKAAYEKSRAAMDWTPEYKPASIVSPNKTASAVADIYTLSSLAMITEEFPVTRKTKIVCTLGPSCWSREGLAALVDSGMGIARFNFSHGDHIGHKEVLDRLREVLAEKDRYVATMLDTKGPEIRTAMLRDGKDILIEAGQEVKVVAVGDEYTKWEGYKDEATGETAIGCSYAALCSSVHEGSLILCADGTLTLQVLEVRTGEVLCKALNKKVLGQRKNMNLPGVKVDLPVLTEKDIDDVQNFCCKNKMDFISVSFVQTAEDVQLVREILDEAGGDDVQIIAKIESMHGLINYDDILQEVNGIMVARGDLAMEIPPEKVSLAQKMMITKANVGGKFIFCATEMLASMADNPLPTRAEMTDVANAVFDGVDGTMLSGETANGKFPTESVQTMARIVRNADMTASTYIHTSYLRDHTSKPFSALESMGSAVCFASLDSQAGLLVTISDSGRAAGYVSKYRAPVPQMVVSTREQTLRHCNGYFGQVPVHVPQLTTVADLVLMACRVAKEQGYWSGEGIVVVVHGREGPDADHTPAFRAIHINVE